MWEIALVVLSLVFCITCFFLIRALISLKALSENGTRAVRTLESKLDSLDSLFQSISNLGDICESKSSQLKELYFQKESLKKETPSKEAEFIDWALSGVRLYQQFKKK